jgi:hypothetical protein
MKITYIIINIFLTLNINSCLAQDNKPKTDTITSKANTMNRPQLNDSFEKLNLDDFKGLVITKERIKVDTNKWEDVEVYEYNKDDGKESIRLTGSFVGSSCYTSTKENSYYTVVKTYFKSGTINRKWVEYTLQKDISLIIGKEYRFNENGQLEKVIDHDLGWNFSFEDVLQYIQNRGLLIKHEDGYWTTEISKKESESEDCRKYWEVIVDTRKVTGKSTWEVIKLDAKTGEILYQIELEGDREWHADIENQVPKQRIIKEDRTSNEIYQTYKGKGYTYDQWLKFKDEFHEDYINQNKK